MRCISVADHATILLDLCDIRRDENENGDNNNDDNNNYDNNNDHKK